MNNRKTAAGTIAGSIAVILAFLAEQFGINVDGAVIAAVAALIQALGHVLADKL